MNPQAKIFSDREFWLDASMVVAISVAICTVSDQLAFMSAFVPSVIFLRFILWARLGEDYRSASLAGELVFFLICTGLGAFNDWNSVFRHEIYDYHVPHYFPTLSTIPFWMLLYWGLILRFLARLGQWQGLAPLGDGRNRVRLGRQVVEKSWLKVALQLVLLMVTRQLIYRNYLDPIWSWLPFAVAILAFALLFGFDRHDRRVVLLMSIGGPIIEILYIQLGNLHFYHHGWLGGVPVWIALWWVLGILIWKDLSARIQAMLRFQELAPIQ
jgi:hypothetical protein